MTRRNPVQRMFPRSIWPRAVAVALALSGFVGWEPRTAIASALQPGIRNATADTGATLMPAPMDRIFLLAAAESDLATKKAVTPRPEPLDPPRKRKAGFLAAAGLVILSLLVLAAGLALLRAFRQR